MFIRCMGPAALLLASLWCSGCREKEPEIDIISLEGSVEKVEIQPDGTGKISVWYHNEKTSQETLGSGIVTAQTEIMINGAAARLSEIRAGDRVRGDVRLERAGDQRTLTVLKIMVDRPEPVAPATGG